MNFGKAGTSNAPPVKAGVINLRTAGRSATAKSPIMAVFFALVGQCSRQSAPGFKNIFRVQLLRHDWGNCLVGQMLVNTSPNRSFFGADVSSAVQASRPYRVRLPNSSGVKTKGSTRCHCPCWQPDAVPETKREMDRVSRASGPGRGRAGSTAHSASTVAQWLVARHDPTPPALPPLWSARQAPPRCT